MTDSVCDDLWMQEVSTSASNFVHTACAIVYLVLWLYCPWNMRSLESTTIREEDKGGDLNNPTIIPFRPGNCLTRIMLGVSVVIIVTA